MQLQKSRAPNRLRTHTHPPAPFDFDPQDIRMNHRRPNLGYYLPKVNMLDHIASNLRRNPNYQGFEDVVF